MKILIEVPDTHDDLMTLTLIGSDHGLTRVFTTSFNLCDGNKISITGDADDLREIQSTADVVEVVRCHDCRYGGTRCDVWDGCHTDLNGYCHYGE